MEPSKITCVKAQRREGVLETYLPIHESRLCDFFNSICCRAKIETNHSCVVVVAVLASRAPFLRRRFGLFKWDGRRVSLEQSNVTKQLVFPRKCSATGTEPLVFPAVLLVGFEIGNDRELLGMAAAASEAFVAVGAFIVVLHA